MAITAVIELKLPRKSIVRLAAVTVSSLLIGIWFLLTSYSEHDIARGWMGSLITLGGLALGIWTIRYKVSIAEECVELVRFYTTRIAFDAIETVEVPDFGTMILHGSGKRIKVRDKWPVSDYGLRKIASNLAGRDILFDGDRRGIREYFGTKADLAPDATTFERERESTIRVLQLMADDAPSNEIEKNWPITHLRSGLLRGWFESISEDWIHMPQIKVINGQADESSPHYGLWLANQFEIMLALEVLRCDASEAQLEEVSERVRQMDDVTIDTIPRAVREAYCLVVANTKSEQR